MNTRRAIRAKAVVPVLSVLVVLSVSTTAVAGECGPGPNWVDGCPAGVDELYSGAVVGIDTSLNGTPDTNLTLYGPTKVDRREGTASGIITEILSMSLEGGGATLVAGTEEEYGLPTSMGAIIQQEEDDRLADSYFDVFFEVDIGDGIPLHNEVPVRVRTVIRQVPPATTYMHVITEPIELFTPGGSHVANLVTADHTTRPRPYPAVSAWGMTVLVLILLTGIALKFRQCCEPIEAPKG